MWAPAAVESAFQWKPNKNTIFKVECQKNVNMWLNFIRIHNVIVSELFEQKGAEEKNSKLLANEQKKLKKRLNTHRDDGKQCKGSAGGGDNSGDNATSA